MLVAAVIGLTLTLCGFWLLAPSPGTDDDTSTSPTGLPGLTLPTANGDFDYQIGGDYALPAGTDVVSRDWFEGSAAATTYTICYVNAFQTQPDEPDVSRPDETSAWPADLVLSELAQDPSWTGEYLIDLSTP